MDQLQMIILAQDAYLVFKVLDAPLPEGPLVLFRWWISREVVAVYYVGNQKGLKRVQRGSSGNR